MASMKNGMFCFLRNFKNIFKSRHIILYSHPQCMNNLVSLDTHKHFSWSPFYFSHSDSVQRHLTVLLICVSLMDNDVKYLFTCYLIYMYFFSANYLFMTFANFIIGFLLFFNGYILKVP